MCNEPRGPWIREGPQSSRAYAAAVAAASSAECTGRNRTHAAATTSAAPPTAPNIARKVVLIPTREPAIPPRKGSLEASAGSQERLRTRPSHMRPAPPALRNHLSRSELRRAESIICCAETRPAVSMKRVGPRGSWVAAQWPNCPLPFWRARMLTPSAGTSTSVNCTRASPTRGCGGNTMRAIAGRPRCASTYRPTDDGSVRCFSAGKS
mmetsp:Transcript_74428/g.147914  ORF Transcript_74428/g.147914 Transcript_74428/m.147914 type:complete len:209 (-) Transcript_74428:1112-1738(-)